MKKKLLVVIIIAFIILCIFLFKANNKFTTKVINYNGNNLKISIDGNISSTLPKSGTYYLANYDCDNINTKVSWDRTNYKLNVTNGSKKGNVSCYLEFQSNPLLSDMPEGSYVSYTGNNGCSGEACNGQNASYESDTSMGYCSSSSYRFYRNGWRIGYIENGSAHLVSGGAPECINTYIDYVTSSEPGPCYVGTAQYYYGSGYVFDKETGYFSLTGVSSSGLEWATSYTDILENYRYTCQSTDSSNACSTLLEMVGYSDTTNAYCYYHSNYDGEGVPNHITNLDDKASKYCNKNFAYGGVCDNNSAWAMGANDFKKITGSVLSSSSCYNKSSNMSCGYNNDLIDNGGYYWFATPQNETSSAGLYFYPNYRYINSNNSSNSYGLRPILNLEPTVRVTGGDGTYKNPYTIGNNSFWINNGADTVSNADKSSVNLSLMTVNATKMCISTNTSICTNYVDFNDTYTLDWSDEDAGEKVVYVYYKDSSGNIVASVNRSITLTES